MNEHTQDTNATDLTPAEVRRRIAERLGWRVEGELNVYRVYGPSAPHALKLYTKQAWAWKYVESQIPDWPNDAGAALALCLEVLDRLNSGEMGEGMKRGSWDFSFSVNSVHYRFWMYGSFTSDLWEEGRDALALAKLALAALGGAG